MLGEQLDEFGFVADQCFGDRLKFGVRRFGGAVQFFAGADTSFLLRGQSTSEDSGGDQGAGDAEVQSKLAHPLPGALGASDVQDFVDQEIAAALVVFDAENVAGDFDQVALQFAFVPGFEDVVKFLVGQSAEFVKQLVCFTDQLHVAVFDAVVHHFDVVAGATAAEPLAAGNVVVRADFGGDRLKHFFDVRPGVSTTTRHQARAFQCAFFATTDATADVQQTGFFDLLDAALGVLKVFVSTVDDDVARFAERQQLFDDCVNGGTCFDQHHQFARAFDGFDKLLDRVGADEVFASRTTVDQLVYLAGGSVVHSDLVSTTLDVEGQILAHNCQAN